MYDKYYDDNTEQVSLYHWEWKAKKKRLEAVNIEWMNMFFKFKKKSFENKETQRHLDEMPKDFFSSLVGWQAPPENYFRRKRSDINKLCAEIMGVDGFKDMTTWAGECRRLMS